MNIENLLVDWIKGEEGFREKAYLDSLGIPTFGYGFTDIIVSALYLMRLYTCLKVGE